MSRSPQKTSPRNCWTARWSIGPRQITGVPGAVNMPIEMTFTPCATGGTIMSSSFTGGVVTPSMRGIEKP